MRMVRANAKKIIKSMQEGRGIPIFSLTVDRKSLIKANEEGLIKPLSSNAIAFFRK